MNFIKNTFNLFYNFFIKEKHGIYKKYYNNHFFQISTNKILIFNLDKQ
jgi:hypothetical protein